MNSTEKKLAKQIVDITGIQGQCYVASEVFYHLIGGKPAGYKPMTIRHEGIIHWFLCGPNGIIDLTAKQFKTKVPYKLGRGRGFLTKYPSKRAQNIINVIR